ncbi:molybdenum cofactor biosynthesis protein [Polymorphobacter multimanifer]|uniref:Molybdenum cofactor synthesis domain-containing protein n=1 Tax=Polymorphobacter multimanifer TaxID=1070431 RepID=A0A841LAP9_9SPHN|nr:molybdopterin-binding protein [Polymorphobacter multimanifer]MBB6226232.1 molybdenum cofactor synthesis domain-containing protein [Polymorphobacter multimanifer]GGI79705.1 molybdenum cofactor biosynthesis protein [Polymorphobacter multimanifer]
MDIAAAPLPGEDADRVWTAALLIIGDEILSGRTQDANLAYLAKWLGVQGIQLREVRVVADDMAAIGDAVKALSSGHDYLFTTGGIGPTHDDITVDAIAAALGVPVIVHPDAQAILAGYYGDKLNDARLRMARTPEGASLIHNPKTKAPGIRIGNIFIMAGVPIITQGMLAALDGQLQGGKRVLSRTIGAWTQESAAADTLAAVEKAHPGVQIGSYPFWREGLTGANFVLRSTSQVQLDAVAAALVAALAEVGIPAVDAEI